MFNIFKKDPVKIKLRKLKISPYDYHHKRAIQEELTIEEEVEDGKVREYGGLYEGQNLFLDHITITDYKEGNKHGLFYKVSFFDEKDIRNLIDQFFAVLACDRNGKGAFNTDDLTEIRNFVKGTLDLRNWSFINNDKYSNWLVNLSLSKNGLIMSDELSIVVHVMEFKNPEN